METIRNKKTLEELREKDQDSWAEEEMSSSLRSAITEEHPKKLVIPCFRVLCSPRGLEEEGFEGKKYGGGASGNANFLETR